MTERHTTSSRPLRGWAAAVLLPLSAFLLAAWFVDPAALPAASGRVGAAVALRDRVDETEILLTWTFARPRLEAAYAEVVCITQRQRALFQPADQEALFVTAVSDLAARHSFVDLYLLAHSNLVIEWVEALPDDVRAKLRVVYNSGCRGGQQAERWRDAGVRAYVGHPESASHAGFFVCFLRRWPGGEALGEATDAANAAQDRLFSHLGVIDSSFERARQRWLGSRAVVTGQHDLTIAGTQEGD